MIFNFRLLFINFNNFIFIFPFLLIFIFSWIFFIKNNFYSIRINSGFNDILKNSNFLKKNNFLFLIEWLNSNYYWFFLYIYLIRLDNNVFWFNHLKIDNFIIGLVYLILLVSLFITKVTTFFKNSNINYNLDYFFSIYNLIIFVPILYLSNNLYSFLFLLELISLIILYKFSVSRNWFNTDKFINIKFNRLLPKSYLNMLFFQYWTNFFSSMLIMFSVFSLIFFFGSTDWALINIFYNKNKILYYYNNYFIHLYIWFSFITGLFFKIGFTPLHLFKVEVYKGIPFFSLFFYTTWYFISFFLYFTVIIYYNLSNLNIYFNLIFTVFILIGLFYSITLLFDVNLLKSFFAYSTVVNVLNFIIVIFLILN